MFSKKDVLAGLFFIVLGLIYLVYSFEYSAGTFTAPLAGFFPRVIGILIILTSFIILLFSIRNKNKKESLNTLWGDLKKKRLFPAIKVVAVIAAYLVFLESLGFLLTSPFLVFFLAILLGGKNNLLNAVTAVAATGLTYWVFWIMMRVPIPLGSFWAK